MACVINIATLQINSTLVSEMPHTDNVLFLYWIQCWLNESTSTFGIGTSGAYTIVDSL